MKPYPATSNVHEAELSGHLWMQELPTGGRLRFQVAGTGLITFGVDGRTYDSADAVPLPYRLGAQSIAECLDRGAFEAAVDDPEGVTFFGWATRNEGVDYDWAELPAFVGTDVWSGNRDAYLPPDAATSVFERLGLDGLPAVEKECPVAHTDLGQYEEREAFPPSAWTDEPAAGLLIRDKSGGRAVAWRPELTEERPDPASGTVDDLADEYVTDGRIERTIQRLRDQGESTTVDAIRDRLLADLGREAYPVLYRDGEPVVDEGTLRSAVAERIQRYRHGDG